MSKDRFIKINGKEIPVSEEVYFAYKRPAWTERKRQEVRADKERSLEVFINDGFDIPSEQALVDEIVADKLLLDELYVALAELTDNERKLINTLYYQEKSERDVAANMGVSQNTVNYHKNRLLDKLRCMLRKKL